MYCIGKLLVVGCVVWTGSFDFSIVFFRFVELFRGIFFYLTDGEIEVFRVVS